MIRRLMLALASAAVLAGCGPKTNHNQAVFFLVDTSGTYAKEVGKAQLVQVTELVGFEPLDTPYGSYPVTARLEGVEGFGVLIRAARQVVTTLVAETSWYAEGLGLVGRREGIAAMAVVSVEVP